MNKIYYGWQVNPLAYVAKEIVALNRDYDFSQNVVIIPSSRAGRNLIKNLYQHSSIFSSYIIPPKILTPAGIMPFFFQHDMLAGKTERLLAWIAAIKYLTKPLVSLIANDNVLNNSQALALLAGKIDKLYIEISEYGKDFFSISEELLSAFSLERVGETFLVLAKCAESYKDLLQKQSLVDPHTHFLSQLDKLKQGEIKFNSIKKVFFVGCVELTPLVRAVALNLPLETHSFINAPDSLNNLFDEVGCLNLTKAEDFKINFNNIDIRYLDNSFDQGREVAKTVKTLTESYPYTQISVGLIDESISNTIYSESQILDIKLRRSKVVNLANFSLIGLIKDLQSFFANKSLNKFVDIVRHPWLSSWLSRRKLSTAKILSEISYYQSTLPVKLILLNRLCSKKFPNCHYCLQELDASLNFLNRETYSINEYIEQFYLILKNLLATDPHALTLSESNSLEKLYRKLDDLENLSAIQAQQLNFTEFVTLISEEIREESADENLDEQIELIGWLELPLDQAANTILTSFTDEHIPASLNEDVYLPNQARILLGLPNNESKLIRDLYCFKLLSETRDNLVILVPRADKKGEKTMPSRLLYQDSPTQTAKRVIDFFRWKNLDNKIAGEYLREQLNLKSNSVLTVELDTLAYDKFLAEPIPVSALSRYQICSYRFYLEYVLKISDSELELRELTNRTYGTLAHKILYLLIQEELKGRDIYEENYLNTFFSEFLKSYYPLKILPTVNLQLYYLKERLKSFLNVNYQLRREGWQTLHQELEISNMFKVGSSKLNLFGRIDRVDYQPNTNSVLIIDYKTSDTPSNPNDDHFKNREWQKLQLPSYYILFKENLIFKNLNSPTLNLAYFNLPKLASDTSLSFANWSDDDLNRAYDTVFTVLGKINNREINPPLPLEDEYSWMF
jgi:ATP-dependent helicase/nuclease subunit B